MASRSKFIAIRCDTMERQPFHLYSPLFSDLLTFEISEIGGKKADLWLAIFFGVLLLLQIKPKIDMFPYVSNHPAMFNFWWTLHSKHVKVHDPLVEFNRIYIYIYIFCITNI